MDLGKPCRVYVVSVVGLDTDKAGGCADRLTTLGPRPIIASLSLGATRIFRIKCMTPHADATTRPMTPLSGWQQSVQLPVSGPPHAAQGGVDYSANGPTRNARPSAESSCQYLLQTGRAAQRQEFVGMQDAADGSKASRHCMQEGMQSNAPKGQQAALHGGNRAAPQQKQQSCPKPGIQSVCSADVQLPHNTLVIMWPPMQEAWKHEVSPANTLCLSLCSLTPTSAPAFQVMQVQNWLQMSLLCSSPHGQMASIDQMRPCRDDMISFTALHAYRK